MKKLLLAIFCLSILLGCKGEDEKKEPVAVLEEVKEPSKLKVEIEYISDKGDIMQCVFNNIELDNGQLVNHILTENTVKGSRSDVFEMFGDYVPMVVQLKYGKKPKTVDVKSITISYWDVSINIDGTKLNDYFVFNKFIKYTPEKGSIETKTIAGKHFPTMTLKRPHINKLFSL